MIWSDNCLILLIIIENLDVFLKANARNPGKKSRIFIKTFVKICYSCYLQLIYSELCFEKVYITLQNIFLVIITIIVKFQNILFHIQDE